MATSPIPSSRASATCRGVTRACSAQPVVLELDPVVPAPKMSRYSAATARARCVLPREEELRQLRREAAGQAGEPLRVLGEQLLVHPWPVVEALEVRGRHELQEVPIAGLVAREQGQMVVLLLVLSRLAVEPGARRHVRLHPEDRLDAVRARRLVEAEGAEHDPVIGDRHRRHRQTLGLGEDRRRGSVGRRCLDTSGAVQQRVLGVHVQMNEAVSRRRGDLRRAVLHIPVFHIGPRSMWKLT